MAGEQSYFPVDNKGGENAITAFEAEWYSKSLVRMNEPRLPPLAEKDDLETYRLMVLPTWGNPIVVRIEKRGKIFSVFARRLDGQGGYDPGKLAEAKDIALSPEESQELENLLQSLNFFQLSTRDKVNGLDGDEWIMEGVSHGKYHITTRWCAAYYDPPKRGLVQFLKLCDFLFNKSQLSVRPQNKGHKLI